MSQIQPASDMTRVLVVEDDPVSAKLVKRVLAERGLTVDQARHGKDALNMHKKHPYRIVVSDWRMPEMDGVSLCRAFRQMPGPYVYFILCSARNQREDRFEGYEAGVDDFLTKPLDRNEMHARLTVAQRILSTEDTLNDQNERLELASERFAGLFNGLPVACFTFDSEGLIQEWNRAAMLVFEIPVGIAAQQPVWTVLKDRAWCKERIKSLFESDHSPSFDWEYRNGSVRKFLACSVITIRDEGDSRKAICANVDITERKLAKDRIEEQVEQINTYVSQLSQQKVVLEQMNDRLTHLAISDGLTGLWNHRKFQEMLEQHVEEFNRTHEPFSLVLLDIDHFKRVNDQLGHTIGDEVLRQFAEILKLQSRSYELPARYGGEEFAIILSCGKDESIFAAERYRSAIQNSKWKHVPITASFGVTTCSVPGTSAKTLIMQADEALYTAKQAGRNRTYHFRALRGNEDPALTTLP